MSEITQGLIDLNRTLPVQIINFLILVALLRAVAYKPIVRMMDERRANRREHRKRRTRMRPLPSDSQ